MHRSFGSPAHRPSHWNVGPYSGANGSKILQHERKLPGDAPGDPLQQPGGVDYPARLCDMVPHGVVVCARQPVPAAELNQSLPLPLQAHYPLGAVVLILHRFFWQPPLSAELPEDPVPLMIYRIGSRLGLFGLPSQLVDFICLCHGSSRRPPEYLLQRFAMPAALRRPRCPAAMR